MHFVCLVFVYLIFKMFPFRNPVEMLLSMCQVLSAPSEQWWREHQTKTQQSQILVPALPLRAPCFPLPQPQLPPVS